MRCIFICIDFLYHAPIAMNQQKFYFELKEGKIKGAVTKSTLRKQHLLEAKRSKKSQKMAQGI